MSPEDRELIMISRGEKTDDVKEKAFRNVFMKQENVGPEL
jgi:hypothetical protein